MTFSEEWMEHAIRLLGGQSDPGNFPDLDARRAVSAAYHALFHHLSSALVSQIAPQADPDAAGRIHRWLDHTEMKKVCREFAAPNLRPPLSDLLGKSASIDMQTVAVSFIDLQSARHSADYDLRYRLSWGEADEFIGIAADAIAAWNRIAPSSESNIFVLSLLPWKKWEMARG
jgi:hypothetical protein